MVGALNLNVSLRFHSSLLVALVLARALAVRCPQYQSIFDSSSDNDNDTYKANSNRAILHLLPALMSPAPLSADLPLCVQ